MEVWGVEGTGRHVQRMRPSADMGGGSQEPATDMELQINPMAEVSGAGDAHTKPDVQAIVGDEGAASKEPPSASLKPEEKVTQTRRLKLLNLARIEKLEYRHCIPVRQTAAFRVSWKVQA